VPLDNVAALFVETGGCYFGLPGVDPWDIARDARLYRGTAPVVAHPPCQRWGRFWHGSTRKPHQFKLGDDGGCFISALTSVKLWGGVIEHPAGSHAWRAHNIPHPVPGQGWRFIGALSRDMAAHTCEVEQGHYGHFSRKKTWLYACVPRTQTLPDLNWEKGEQRIHPRALELHGYEKARRIGMVAMVGGKRKTEIRNATPLPFRDLLIEIARSVYAT
jgi:hypothetical protein